MFKKIRPLFRKNSLRAKPFSFQNIRLPFSSREQIILRQSKKNFFSDKKKFLFESNGFVYDDKHLSVSNGIMTYRSHFPHLVLAKNLKEPRFVLEYSLKKGVLQIKTIQRIRNEYLPHDSKRGEWLWSKHREGIESKKLEKELGMKPAEFLLMELIHKFAPQINNGEILIQMNVPNEKKILYGPMIERFFRKTPTTTSDSNFVLSLQKQRVKKALGLI
ncbi:MAG: hypothetical protein PHP82_01030 [Candidatus ainarchaeum sp.]|nr:hypothetical protein [Candidatus ainarchaeum sp.]